MDESVIFVQELRSGDDDIIVEYKETKEPSFNRRRLTRKAKEPNGRISLIDLTTDFESPTASNKNINLENNKGSNAEVKKTFPECPVCLLSMENLEIKVTNCGHVFCKACMDILVSKPGSILCPICRRRIIKKHIRDIFF